MKHVSFKNSISPVYLLLGIIVLLILTQVTSLVQQYAKLERIKQANQVQGVATVQAQTPQNAQQYDPSEPILPDQGDTNHAVQFGLDLLNGLPNDNDSGIATAGAKYKDVPGGGGSGTAGTPGTGNTANIAQWAQQMANSLGKGCFGYYNALTVPFTNASGYSTGTYPATSCGNPGNLFWCADLVREAYYLAGYTDFVHSSYVPAIRNWFKTGPAGYYYFDYAGETLSPQQLKTIKPGCAIIYGYNSDPDNDRGDHIEIIDTISVDANGNGSLRTDAANSSVQHHNLAINGGVIIPYYREVVGIGCHQ